MTRRTSSLLLAGALALAAVGLRGQDGPARRFVYVGDADLAPFDYLDKDGRPTGFSVDLIRALAADAGVEVEIRLGEWNKVRAEFDSGSADLISMSYSEERAREYLWLARTWSVQQSLLFLPRSGAYPTSIDALAGESLAVQEQSLAAEMLLALPPPRPTVVTVPAQAETLRLLKDGVVTGVGGGSLVLRVAAGQMGMGNFVELPLRTVAYGFVARSGRAAELSWVPASMKRLRDAGALDALAERYLVNPAPPRTLWSYRYWALSILILTLLGVAGAIFWNRALVRSVRLRTQEMERALARGESLMHSLAANEKRFQTFITLSGEGIARAEVNPPMGVERPEAEQIAHIMASTRLAECNRAFTPIIHPGSPAGFVGLGLTDLVPRADLEAVLPLFIRRGYRLAGIETRRIAQDGGVFWISSNVVGVVEDSLLTAIWLTQRDVTEMKRIEKDLRVRGRILEAVAFSSARLLEPGDWKEHLAEVLGRLGEAVGAGCAFISENLTSDDGALLGTLRQEWTASGVAALATEPLFREVPWPEKGQVRLLLEQRRTVPILVRDVPPAGREFLERMGLKSLLIVPVFVDEKWWGMLGFGDFEKERRWSDAEMEALKTAGIAIGAALLREQVEAAVHASEQKHRDIVAFAPVGIYQATREGTLVMANVQFARLLGYERAEEVIGLNFARDVYLNEGDRERFIQEYLSSGQAKRVEVRLRRRDGTVFWAELSAHGIQDPSGKVLFFEGFVQDVTAAKAAADELRASEERYRLLFDGNPVPMLVFDIETLALLAANEAAVAQYGYTREELLVLTLAALATPQDLALPPFAERQREPRPELVRVGLRPQVRKDGSIIEVDITSLAIDFAGKRARLLLNRDVTAERKAEVERAQLGLAIERAAAEWHRTFDSVDLAILVLDREGRLIRVNSPALDLLGPDFATVLGRTLQELAAPEPWESAARMVDSVRSTREGAQARALDAEAGKTWELTANLALAGPQGEERVILVVRDISRLVKLQQSLRRSETMSAMGSLVAGVAHEVRNPLFSISATVDALESELGNQQEYAELTSLLRSQVNRLRQLMRDLLDYGKPPALKFAPVHSREVVRREARACAGIAAERGVHLVEEVPEGMPPIQVDSSRLEQVFQNLLANAIQHSPMDATVRIVARFGVDGAPEFRVEDEGPGLPTLDMVELFAPFFTRRKGGTGLGLPVVQRIVEAHGGRVVAANREGGGAVFTVTLPSSVAEKAEQRVQDRNEDRTEVEHG